MCHYHVEYFACSHYSSGTPVKCTSNTGGTVETCPKYEGERKTDNLSKDCASCAQKKVEAAAKGR
jgi:hypothetical protein